jgi:hypothetical protein
MNIEYLREGGDYMIKGKIVSVKAYRGMDV